MTTAEKIKAYFEENPSATEVHEALGKLFADKEKAQGYLSGVSGRIVTTHTKDGINYERESDRIRHEIMLQENKVAAAGVAYENAAYTDKETAMSGWNKEKSVLQQLNHRLQKQLALEAKEELISKEETTLKPDLKKPELTVEELEAKIKAQVKIVEANEKLIATMTGNKKKTAVKAQAAEVALLESLSAELEQKKSAENTADENSSEAENTVD